MAEDLLTVVTEHLAGTMQLPQPAIDRLLVLARRNIAENIQDLLDRFATDRDVAVRAAHSLKGNLANLGLTALSHTAYALERDVREGLTENVRQRVLDLAESLTGLTGAGAVRQP